MWQWNLKNKELFQDALAKGIENKQKVRKQPFCSSQQKPKYGFSLNNKGKGNSCPYPRICQYCSGKHSRLLCRQKQPWPNRAPPKHVSIKNINHYTTINTSLALGHSLWLWGFVRIIARMLNNAERSNLIFINPLLHLSYFYSDIIGLILKRLVGRM